jgi:hypothetical protein
LFVTLTIACLIEALKMEKRRRRHEVVSRLAELVDDRERLTGMSGNGVTLLGR